MQYFTVFDVIFAANCRELPLLFHLIFVSCRLFGDIFDPHHKICV